MRQKYVEIPEELIEKCRDFAERIVAHYAAGGSPESRAVSGDRGTEGNHQLQMEGKLGEVAVAIYLGQDPFRVVKWHLGSDQGWDLTYCGYKMDVKATKPPFKLIWSRTVNHLYESKKFDVIVSVSVEENDYSGAWIEGVISKKRFFKEKKIADGTNSGLEPGTWFFEKRDLADIDKFIALVSKSKS